MNGLLAGRQMRATWKMAHRRDTSRYRLRLFLAGLMTTTLLTGAIQLGNTVAGLRREVQDLARACDNLEAGRALLAVGWNTESSRQVVMRRARQELGLIDHAAPAAILVSTEDDGQLLQSWPRLVQTLGPVDLTPAALAGPEVR